MSPGISRSAGLRRDLEKVSKRETYKQYPNLIFMSVSAHEQASTEALKGLVYKFN